jgi:hypothetical protein
MSVSYCITSYMSFILINADKACYAFDPFLNGFLSFILGTVYY